MSEPKVIVMTTKEIIKDYNSLPADISTVQWVGLTDYEKLRAENERLKAEIGLQKEMEQAGEISPFQHVAASHNALKAELERVKQELYEAKVLIDQKESTIQNTFNHWQKAMSERDALKQSQRELIEALKFYADEGNWYSVNEHGYKMVIASIDTETDKWVGGRYARNALRKLDQGGEVGG